MRRPDIAGAARHLLWTLAFSGTIASLVVLLGTRDMESYEHAVLSLDRGTALEAVHVVGQPVYTLALGLGVRLPLHGSLAASPAAALAPFLPLPLMYWLLLTVAIGAAALLVRHALEPLCGGPISWVALLLLFCSAPIVNYAIYDDWPETAVTYCAFVGCVFAPHALLMLLAGQRASTSRRVAGIGVAGLVWGLVAVSHPGYWPLLAGALILTLTLALVRSDHDLRTRIGVVTALGAASLAAVGMQAPDILRELALANEAGGVRRFVDGGRGGVIDANIFPFGIPGARFPFTYLALALVAVPIGFACRKPCLRTLTLGCALASLILAAGAGILPPGRSLFAPTVTWALRDPAIAFAVFSGACAAATLRRSQVERRRLGRRLAIAALVTAALQGPAYAMSLVRTGFPDWEDHRPWTRDMSPLSARAGRRGLPADRIPPGERLALWSGVRDTMRNGKRASTEFADAGYLLVSAVWTKLRTMRGLVEPNEILFDQFMNVSSEILCDPDAVHFLQLRYLLLPSDAVCEPWTRVPDVRVDGWLDVGMAEADRRVRVLPVERLNAPAARKPALVPGSMLLRELRPASGTSLTIDATGIMIELDDRGVHGEALVLPVAYDSALRASSGRILNAGGLAALVGVDQRAITVRFVPDFVAVLRAISMTLAQVWTVVGLLALAVCRPVVSSPELRPRSATGPESSRPPVPA